MESCSHTRNLFIPNEWFFRACKKIGNDEASRILGILLEQSDCDGTLIDSKATAESLEKWIKENPEYIQHWMVNGDEVFSKLATSISVDGEFNIPNALIILESITGDK